MPQTVVDKKKEAVKEYGKGVELMALALKYEVSTRTIYRWIAKYA